MALQGHGAEAGRAGMTPGQRMRCWTDGRRGNHQRSSGVVDTRRKKRDVKAPINRLRLGVEHPADERAQTGQVVGVLLLNVGHESFADLTS